MKTIPLCLVLASTLPTAVSAAEDVPNPPHGQGRPEQAPPKRPWVDAWKAADKDNDGVVSPAEFAGLPRLQNLPEDKRERLFKRLDKSGDGKLSRQELSRIGRPRDGMGPPPPMRGLWELDQDRSGSVSFTEFTAGEVFGKFTPEKQRRVFDRLDTNKDGVISPKDRPKRPPHHPPGPHGPESPGEPPHGRMHPPKGPKGPNPPANPPIPPQRLLQQLDENHDGSLTFEEFRKGPMTRQLDEDAQEDHFERLDRNHDLKITADDFSPPADGPAPPHQPPAPPPPHAPH